MGGKGSKASAFARGLGAPVISKPIDWEPGTVGRPWLQDGGKRKGIRHTCKRPSQAYLPTDSNMIQRIQSVYLLLAALLAAMLFALPLAEYARNGGVSFILKLRRLETGEGVPVQDADLKLQPHLIAIVLIGLLLAALLFFRNRPRQLRLVRYSYLVAVLLAVVLWITHNSVLAFVSDGSRAGAVLTPWFFLPFAVLLFAGLAERGIRKDEALVRSADRLR